MRRSSVWGTTTCAKGRRLCVDSITALQAFFICVPLYESGTAQKCAGLSSGVETFPAPQLRYWRLALSGRYASGANLGSCPAGAFLWPDLCLREIDTRMGRYPPLLTKLRG